MDTKHKFSLIAVLLTIFLYIRFTEWPRQKTIPLDLQRLETQGYCLKDPIKSPYTFFTQVEDTNFGTPYQDISADEYATTVETYRTTHRLRNIHKRISLVS